MSTRRPIRPRFQPPTWLRNPHAQTIAGRLLRERLRGRYVRQRLETADGDFLDVDGLDGGGLAPDAPVCLVLHGLEGSSNSGYVVATCDRLRRSGVRPFALNFRSCGGEPNRRLPSYHSGATGDIEFVARWLRSVHPDAPLGAIGYSLGGNALLVHLAGRGMDAGFDAAAAVSVPFDLAAGAAALERGMGRVYAAVFLRSLRVKIREKAERFPAVQPRAAIALRARTLRQLDDAWTAPIHGFRDAAHYYDACSSLSRLGELVTPTLLVQARDDPFLPPETPAAVARVDNPRVDVELTHFGGHLGYVDRRASRRFWSEARAVDWIVDRLGSPARDGV